MVAVSADAELALRTGSHQAISFLSYADRVLYRTVVDCLFCRIVRRESAADVEYEDDHVLAFRDIYPKAPVHVLIVPKRHIESIMALEPGDAETVGRCLVAARKLGELKGFAERGYRVSVNCGPEGGQQVYHVHFHFLAGRTPRSPGPHPR
jgi:histidine triad (HIT) family protein